MKKSLFKVIVIFVIAVASLITRAETQQECYADAEAWYDSAYNYCSKKPTQAEFEACLEPNTIIYDGWVDECDAM